MLDLPDLPDLHCKVVLVIKCWNWSWMCCLGQVDYLVGIPVI